jgi:hypothetical protein
VGPMAGLDGCGKSHPRRNSIPGPSSSRRFTVPTELSRPKACRLNILTYPVYCCADHASATECLSVTYSCDVFTASSLNVCPS